jgi:cytochrome c biogenesis protein ResB
MSTFVEQPADPSLALFFIALLVFLVVSLVRSLMPRTVREPRAEATATLGLSATRHAPPAELITAYHSGD